MRSGIGVMLQVGPSLRGRSSGPAERSAAVPARVARRASAPLLFCCFPFATTTFLVAHLRFALALVLSFPPSHPFLGTSRMDTMYLFSTLDSLATLKYSFHVHFSPLSESWPEYVPTRPGGSSRAASVPATPAVPQPLSSRRELHIA